MARGSHEAKIKGPRQDGREKKGEKKKKRTKKEKFNGVTAVALTAVDLGADGGGGQLGALTAPIAVGRAPRQDISHCSRRRRKERH